MGYSNSIRMQCHQNEDPLNAIPLWIFLCWNNFTMLIPCWMGPSFYFLSPECMKSMQVCAQKSAQSELNFHTNLKNPWCTITKINPQGKPHCLSLLISIQNQLDGSHRILTLHSLEKDLVQANSSVFFLWSNMVPDQWSMMSLLWHYISHG